MSKNILIIGFGDIGRRVKSKLDDKYVVYAINRNPKKSAQNYAHFYNYIHFRLANLNKKDILVNCCANAAPHINR